MIPLFKLTAEYVYKTHILTCTLKYLTGNKILSAKILTQNVLKRQILTDSIAKHCGDEAMYAQG